MKKLIVLIGAILLSASVYSEEPGGTLYIIPGVLKVVGYYNGIKLIKCEAPYENHVCYSFIANPTNSDQITVKVAGEEFVANKQVVSIIDENGETTYYFTEIQ